MPLEQSTSKDARERNIKREIDAGKDPKQAVAIGYSVQREAAKKGKSVADPAPKKPEPNESESFFQHVKNFFMKGPGPDPKKSEIVEKGGPGGQRREANLMDAVDKAMTGATDDE